jgi:hypothetical protein
VRVPKVAASAIPPANVTPAAPARASSWRRVISRPPVDEVWSLMVTAETPPARTRRALTYVLDLAIDLL